MLLNFLCYYFINNKGLICQDHVASIVEERERVISSGGEVKWQVDTWRVGPAALQVVFFMKFHFLSFSAVTISRCYFL